MARGGCVAEISVRSRSFLRATVLSFQVIS